uniref:3'(2'),5'-bisphosphate nucleotidase CysQ n=1 Tax=Paenirhodobacter enshiensis TaxID=1105367 RepID=UPI0035B09980
MPVHDDEADLALLLEVAAAAGPLALSYWKHAPDAWEKDAGAGPVSEADLAVNALMEERLRAARPDYGWLSEESADDPARLGRERVFIVDPIDGTRAFLNEEGGFAHAIAVAERGRVVAAVVSLPVMELVYSATAEGPALRNGTEIRVSDTARADGCRVLTSKLSTDPVQWRGPVPVFRHELRSSLAWRLCLVAEGRFDATLSLRPAWEWDTAAASLIATRAGALATDRCGVALQFNGPSAQSNGVVVAPPVLHAEFITRLRPGPGLD